MGDVFAVRPVVGLDANGPALGRHASAYFGGKVTDSGRSMSEQRKPLDLKAKQAEFNRRYS